MGDLLMVVLLMMKGLEENEKMLFWDSWSGWRNKHWRVVVVVVVAGYGGSPS